MNPPTYDEINQTYEAIQEMKNPLNRIHFGRGWSQFIEGMEEELLFAQSRMREHTPDAWDQALLKRIEGKQPRNELRRAGRGAALFWMRGMRASLGLEDLTRDNVRECDLCGDKFPEDELKAYTDPTDPEEKGTACAACRKSLKEKGGKKA